MGGPNKAPAAAGHNSEAILSPLQGETLKTKNTLKGLKQGKLIIDGPAPRNTGTALQKTLFHICTKYN